MVIDTVFNTFHSLLSSKEHIDYAIIDLSIIKSLRIENYIYDNVKLIDVFQELNSDYLFLKVSQVLLPAVFSIYQESYYEFQHLIPWVKTSFDELAIIDLNSKFRGLIDYFVVFQKPSAKSIKSKISNLIIEPDLITTMNSCERLLIRGLSELGINEGVYVTSTGEMYQCDVEAPITTGGKKIDLF